EDFTAAANVLAQALRQHPHSAEVLYRLGYVEFRQRKLIAARGRLLRVLQLAPPAHNARYFLGRIALLENKPREAAAWLEPVAAARASSFDAASQLALAYAASAQPRRAIAPLQQAIAETPWDGALYYRLGRLHQQLNEPELARQALQTSERLKSANREDVETLMETSRLLAEGRPREAVALGTEKIAERPEADPNSLVALGVVYGRAGLDASAADAFARAVARDAALFAAQYNHGLALLRAGRQAEALDPLARAVELLPQSTDAALAFSLAAVMTQKYAEAVAPLERLMKSPGAAGNPRVPLLLATAYLRTGAPGKAAPLLRPAAAQDPSAALLLIEALAAAQDPAGALQAAQGAAARFPKHQAAQLALARQLTRAGRYQLARPAFEAALTLAPAGQPQPEAELGLADSLQKSGEHAAAIGHYHVALAHPATELPARLGLARSQLATRALTEARRTLEQGLEAHSDDVALRLELSRVYARLGEQELAAHESKIVEQLQQRSAVKP
ncbi:MAG: tetratricopeptide repeat protein, partial [Bryobacterales bacterium]|nr:tetratricopeptide repeat protein [Bryobacterales bacterium]